MKHENIIKEAMEDVSTPNKPLSNKAIYSYYWFLCVRIHKVKPLKARQLYDIITKLKQTKPTIWELTIGGELGEC